MVNEPLAGKRFVKVTERKTKTDWAMLLKEIAERAMGTREIIKLTMLLFF